MPQPNPPRVLVVGGAGYIGGAVTDELARRNIDFTVFDSLLYNQQYLKPVHFIRGDVRDTDHLSAVLASHTDVIWLAGIVGDAACNLDLSNAASVNLALCNIPPDTLKGKRLVYSSSCSVYGYAQGVLTEDSSLNPQSEYARQKITVEQWIVSTLGSYSILRYGTAYGVSDPHSRLRFDLAINRMAVMAAATGQIDVLGGQQWRPWSSVQDIAYATCSALEDHGQVLRNVVLSNTTLETAAFQVREGADPKAWIHPDPATDPRSYQVETNTPTPYYGPRVTITQAAAHIAALVRDGRIRNWRDPIHDNAAWLKTLTPEKEPVYG